MPVCNYIKLFSITHMLWTCQCLQLLASKNNSAINILASIFSPIVAYFSKSGRFPGNGFALLKNICNFNLIYEISLNLWIITNCFPETNNCH